MRLNKTLLFALFMMMASVLPMREALAAIITISPTGGNWSATTAWIGAVVPTAADDVIATSLSGNLTIDGTSGSPSLARSVDFTGYTHTLTNTSTHELDIGDSGGGSFTLVSGMIFAPNGTLKFVSTTTGNTITTAGKTLGPITFNGSGGAWSLADPFLTTLDITLTSGTVTATNTIGARAVSVNGGTLNLGGNVTGTGTFTVAGGAVSGSSYTVSNTSNTWSSGSLNIKGVSSSGSITASGATATLGSSGASSTTINVSAGSVTSGGAVTATTGSIGVTGTGTLDATGQTLTSATSLTMSSSGALKAANLSMATTMSMTAGTTTITGNVSGTTLSLSGSTLRTINMGNGSWTLSGTGNVFSAGFTPTNILLNAQGSTINITDTSATVKTIIPGNLQLNNLSISGAASSALVTLNAFTAINVLTLSPDASLKIIHGTTNVLSSLVATGTSGHPVTIISDSAGSQSTISLPTGTFSGNYLALKDTATTGGSAFYAGVNSVNNGNNSGWIFATKPPSGQSFTSGGG